LWQTEAAEVHWGSVDLVASLHSDLMSLFEQWRCSFVVSVRALRQETNVGKKKTVATGVCRFGNPVNRQNHSESNAISRINYTKRE